MLQWDGFQGTCLALDVTLLECLELLALGALCGGMLCYAFGLLVLAFPFMTLLRYKVHYFGFVCVWLCGCVWLGGMM